MPNKKSILFVTHQYRAGERIYPTIPYLAEKYNIDLVKLYEMHPNYVWQGDKDMREVFDKKYSKFFTNTYLNPKSIPYPKYDLILADDSRTFNGLDFIYANRKCLMVGCNHGNSDHGYNTKNINSSYDACFVFGQKEAQHNFQIPSGIPSNDGLKNYIDVPKEHILIVVNHLGNYGAASSGMGYNFKLMDKKFFDQIKLTQIQKHYNKPIVIKLKSRSNRPTLQENIEYVHSIIPSSVTYKIVVDVEDDNLLVAQSSAVIGAPSTLMFKPIQLGIPTALIKGYGQPGKFADYLGLVDSNHNEIMQALSLPKQTDFIQKTIEGGLTWNSTEYFTHYVDQLING
jgi:hypothetical protein